MNPFFRSATLATLVLLMTIPVQAQDLGLKAAPQNGPIAIAGVKIFTVSGEVIELGWMTFDEGLITGVGSGELKGFQGEVIDGAGRQLYPGLIHPHTVLGLKELGQPVDVDFSELGSVKPEVRAFTAVNPDSTLIPVARANGILLAGVFPIGGLIPGRASVCKLDGWTNEEMTVQREAGLSVNWPLLRPVLAPWMRKSAEDQRKDSAKEIRQLRELFESARAYLSARQADSSIPVDQRMEAMRAVFPPDISGRPEQMPVFASAQQYEQIVSALSFAREFSLKLVIVGGSEAHLCASLLREQDVPVLVLGTHRLPRRADSAYDEAWRLPSVLEAAGVRWCLASSDGNYGNDRNLPYHAAAAVLHGLDASAALRAITLSPAEVLGIADRYGSIEKGKSATVILTDGSPFEITTRIERAFIDGRQVDLENKQTRLRDKYTEKYRRLGL